MCVEWVKANPALVPAPGTPSRELHETLSPVTAPEATFALQAPPPRLERPQRHLTVVATVPAPSAPILELPDRAELESLEREVAEVHLVYGNREVWLVREKTGQNRRELTFSAARCISDVVAALGAKLEGLTFVDE